MKKVIFILVFSLVFSISGCKQEKEITALRTYEMEVYLNEDHDTYNNKGELTALMGEELDELYIMFYSNAQSEAPDYNIKFEYLRVNGEDVEYTFTGLDNSAVHIELDEPLGKDERVYVEFDYESGFHDEGRLSNHDGIVYSMFFFPTIAMKDETGWNIEPFTFYGETYYNEIGDYDIIINVPEDYIIAAPGELQSSKVKYNRLVERYELKDARDFSFSASDFYTKYEKVVNDRTYEVYSVRELSSIEEFEVFDYLENSFRVYEEYIGPFPYDRFVLELGFIYGMESTGIIYCSEDINEGTIVHEVIHQWFMFIIGNDPYDYSFLDESLTTYATSLYYYDKFGIDGYNGMLDGRSSNLERLSEYKETYYGHSLLQTVDDFDGGYGYLIYYHGPTLYRYYVDEFLDGDIEKFYEIMQVYYNTYAYKNVTLDQYLTLLEEESGVEGTKAWFMENIQEMKDLE